MYRFVEPAPLAPMVPAPTTAHDPLAAARVILDRILADPESVTSLALVRTPGRYERNFLFGDGESSVWAMTWAPGSATAIHDHHCSCCFGVLSGTVLERRFQREDDRVVQTFERLRQPGFTAGMLPTGPNIHQMLNLSDEEAISIHVYGFDRALHASSVHREYHLLGA